MKSQKRSIRLGLAILHWFCPEKLRESIEGDLLENFENDVERRGYGIARWIFLFNVMRFFRWGIISRNQFQMMHFNFSLIINHIKITLRNFIKHVGYTAINLLGLAVGIGTCIVIFSYTQHELNYDAFFSDVDRMYRVNQTNIWAPSGGMMSSTTPPLARELQENFPEIISATRINTPGSFEVRYKNTGGELITYQEDQILAADSNFFDFFNIPIIEGDPQQMLNGKNLVVLTESTAHRYFGNQSPIGQVLLFGDDKRPVMVSGLVSDLPSNMHFNFDMLLSMSTNISVKQFDWSWVWTQLVTYVKIANDVNLEGFSTKMTALLMPKVQSTFSRLGMDFDDFMKEKGTWEFELQPVRDIHLYAASIGNRIGSVGDIKVVRILQLMAVLILLIAVINFINLSTARANIRSREIGVKKTLGATVRELGVQFQVEALLMTFIGSVLSIPVVKGLSTFIFKQAGIKIYFNWANDLLTLCSVGFLLVIIGLMAGIYPAVYLSRLKPISVIDQQKTVRRGRFNLRNVLVAVQFTISLGLLSGALMVTKQLNYIGKKDLGFDKENILVLRNAGALGDQISSFRDNVANLPEISGASVTMAVPGEMSFEDFFQREGSSTKLTISQVKVDPEFASVMNLKMSTGHFFQKHNEADKNHAVINETTAKLFGWTPQEALGKRILYPGDDLENPEIIGVVSDFHFQSLYEDIKPLLLLHIDSPMWGDQRMLVVRYHQNHVEKAISAIETAWSHFTQDSPFTYSILDEDLNRMYTRDSQLSVMVRLLSLLSIFTAILGLIGLVSFTVDQRRKEIGIRKVLGASSGSIFFLINRQYIILYLIGLCCSVPLTWWFLNKWLQNFAYHIEISWGTFIIAGVLLLVSCLLSVGYLALQAARANPVDAISDN
ncbi:MAG: ABC transporter permease [Saprospiraceae bacterium]|nr:ABC transporter permease [Saprospiraceae bacterium]